MENKISKQKVSFTHKNISELHQKTQNWISEINFIKIEQNFLRELIGSHILELCNTNSAFNEAKFLLKGIDHEDKLGHELIKSIDIHKMNLALLIENIYLKKEDEFRKDHTELKNEVINYIQNFKYIKKQVFELVLKIMKKEKQKKMLTK